MIGIKRTNVFKYTVRKEDRWYASVMLDDEVGEITIHSEWGDFMFGWYPQSRGTKTLREFLVGCDSSYLNGKFLHSYRQAGVGVKALDHIEKRLLIFLSDLWPALRDEWKSELEGGR